MKRSLGLVAALALTILTGGFQQSPDKKNPAGWSEFSSKEGAFTVLMLDKPTQQVQQVDTDFGKLECHLLIGSRGDSEAFIVSYADFPGVITEPNTINRILDGARDQGFSSIKGKLVRETTLHLDGHIGREVAIEGPDGNLQSRIYWVGRRLYQMIAITQRDKPAARQEVERFLGSFKLVGDLAASLQQPAWIEFSSEKGGFVVSMPTKPTEQTMPAGSESGQLNVYLYVSLGPEGTAYLASYADVPGVTADQGQTMKELDDVRNGQLKSTKGKLQSETTISLDGFPGREFKIETSTGLMIARIFLVRRRLYQLVAIIPEAVAGAEGPTRDAARFLSSFKLTSR